MNGTRVLALVALVMVASGAPMQAQDKEKAKEEIFKKALDAREKPNNWAEAEKLMRQAIGLDSKESLKTYKRGLLGLVAGGTEYLPYFFLGEALERQGDCAGAMAAWATSEQQGVVVKVEKYAQQMQRGLAACEQKGLLRSPKFDQALVAGTDEVAKAAAAVEATRGRGAAAGDLYTAERRSHVDEAAKLTKESQARLDSVRRTRAAAEFAEITNTTRRVLVILGGVDKELLTASLARDEYIGRLASLDRAIDDANGIDRAIENKKNFLTDGLASTRQAGKESLGRARKASDAAHAANTPGSIAEGAVAVETAVRQLREVLNEATEIERRTNIAISAQELRAVRQKFSLLEGGFKNFDKRAAAAPADPKSAAQRQALERRTRAGLQTLNAAAKDGNAAAIQAAGRIADQVRLELDRMLTTFGPLTIVERGVPEALANGARRFLAGDFTGALADLAPEGGFPADAPFLDHVYVFRAAARYELSLRAGADAPTHLAEARAAVAAITGLNPTFEPDSRAFSPRFREFFRSARANAQGTSSPAPPPAAQ